jgi:hypothetical protein
MCKKYVIENSSGVVRVSRLIQSRGAMSLGVPVSELSSTRSKGLRVHYSDVLPFRWNYHITSGVGIIRRRGRAEHRMTRAGRRISVRRIRRVHRRLRITVRPRRRLSTRIHIWRRLNLYWGTCRSRWRQNIHLRLLRLGLVPRLGG